MVPESVPDWRELWEDGRRIGRGIEIRETPFMRENGVKNDVDYRMRQAARGKLSWRINMGLGSVEEEAAGLRAAERFNLETGLKISFAHQLPKNIVGTPMDKRGNVPRALGFDLDRPEDWLDISMASTVQAVFADNHLGYPNAVFTTVNSLAAGSMYQGMFGQFQHSVPGCPDDVWNMSENVKALGIIAARYDDKVVVDSNVDDSVPAYCMDLASALAWGRLERYIVSDLCRARYAFSFGNFTTDLIQKAAMWVAASDTFKLSDQPGIGFIYPNTVDHWDHHIHANYGFQIPEALMAILLERRFKTGATFISVPITEKITIPTVQEMLDMSGACQRAEECADAFERMMDWTEVERLSRRIIDFSGKMYDNIIGGLEEAGVDIGNPIEMMVVLKRMDPTKLEALFHPSVVGEGSADVVPLMPAALWQMSVERIAQIAGEYRDTDMLSKLSGKRVCVVSADIHYFGALVIAGVLKELGVDVINGGNSVEAIDVLDLADEYGVSDICISLHNGQTLNYARLLLECARERGGRYRFFMGGVLTGFINGEDTEPTDVTDIIRDEGIIPANDVGELLSYLAG
jgi:methylmalonyl-CoA mutase cobalamin-binding subunit